MGQEFNGKIYRLYKGERYFSRGVKRLHRVVWEFFNGAIPKGFHVHHKDENPHNNSIKNLELKSSFHHLSGHMTLKRKQEQRDWIDKIRPLASKWHASQKGREWHSKLGKLTWINRKLFKVACNFCRKTYETVFPTRSQYCHQNCKMKARTRRLREKKL